MRFPWCFAVTFAFAASIGSTTLPAKPSRCLIQVTGADTSLMEVSVQRIRDYYPGTVDVLHGSGNATALSRYDLTLVLGTEGSDDRLSTLWTGQHQRDPDSYRVKTLGTGPLLVAVTGRSPRGTMYAAYRLAELLETNADLAKLDLERTPEVKRRYAFLCASSFGGAYTRNMLFLKELRELPRYGFNGVCLFGYDDCNTPAGASGAPLSLHGKEIVPVPSQVAEWRLLLQEIKRYGLDIILVLPPLFPGEYQASQIARHYSGEAPIPNYDTRLAAFFSEYLQACTDALPDLDGVFLLNWEYPGNVGAQMFTINSRDNHYRFGKRDPRRSADVLETYAATLERFGRARKKTVGFIAHLAGVRSGDIRAMHEVLFRHEDLIKIEPPFFPDTGWPNLSAFGDWPADLSKKKLFGGRWGWLMTTTTGQYYGGGSLPTAFPDPFVHASGEAVAHHAEIVVMLLDVWDATALGNLFNIDEILPLAAAAELWSPTPSLADTWRAWTNRRFGPVAGPMLEEALQSSRTIVRDGLTLQGVDLMVHGAIREDSWRPPGLRVALFAQPGSPVFTPSDDGFPNTTESMAAQMNARAVPMKEFRERQGAALAAALAGSKAVEAARPHLSAGDYAYLKAVFDDSRTVLQAISLIGEAAHAANLSRHNFEGIADPGANLAHALDNLERYADRVEGYRSTAPEQSERSSSGLVINPSLRLTLRKISDDLRAYAAGR